MHRSTSSYLSALLNFATAIGLNTEYFEYIELENFTARQLRGLSQLLQDMEWSEGDLPEFDLWKIAFSGRDAIQISASDQQEETIMVLNNMQNVYGARFEFDAVLLHSIVSLMTWTGRAHVQLKCCHNQEAQADEDLRYVNFNCVLDHIGSIIPLRPKAHVHVLDYHEEYRTGVGGGNDVPLLVCDAYTADNIASKFTALVSAIQTIDSIQLLFTTTLYIPVVMFDRLMRRIQMFCSRRYGDAVQVHFTATLHGALLEVRSIMNQNYKAQLYQNNTSRELMVTSVMEQEE